MRLPLVSRNWHYVLGFDSEVDFCFWILERDGLRLPPFDRHADGDGLLRAAGLDAASWYSWLERVIGAFDARRKALRASIKSPAEIGRLRALQPEELWDGAAAVGSRLKTLAEEYDEIYNERAGPKLELVGLNGNRAAKLWEDIAPYRRSLPSVTIAAVSYPGPLQAVEPPKTILLAVGAWKFTPDELAESILRGMKALAEGGRARPRSA